MPLTLWLVQGESCLKLIYLVGPDNSSTSFNFYD